MPHAPNVRSKALTLSRILPTGNSGSDILEGVSDTNPSQTASPAQLPDLPSINVTLPDGSVRTVPAGTTPYAIAYAISPRLADAVVVAKIVTTKGEPTADGAKEAEDPAHGGAGTEQSMYAAAPTAERLVDLAEPIHEDVHLTLLKEQDPEAQRVLRHSAAHVMATAIAELYPETRFGHGPATDNGFFYDVLREKPFTPDDLIAIETRMAEIVARNEPFRHEYIGHEEALPATSNRATS